MNEINILLPKEENSSQIYATIVDSYRQITNEISSKMNEKLTPILGDNWQNDLANKRQSRVNLKDPEFIFKEPLRNQDSPVRLCLPRNKQFYDKLELAWKQRNKWFHNEAEGTSKEATKVIDNLIEIAKELELTLTSSLEFAKIRLNQITNGKEFQNDGAELKIDNRLHEMEEQILDLTSISNEAQLKLLKAEQRESELETEIQSIQQSLNSKSSKVDQSKDQIQSLNFTIQQLQESLERAQNEREDAIQVAGETNSSIKELKKFVENLTNIEKADVRTAISDVPEIGGLWPHPRGTYRLTLSPRFNELYFPRSSTLLSDLLGEDAKTIATNWLKIRNTGGRVYLNDSGHACTFSGENLIYLGKIEDQKMSQIISFVDNN